MTTWIGHEGMMLSNITQRKTNTACSSLHVQPKKAELSGMKTDWWFPEAGAGKGSKGIRGADPQSSDKRVPGTRCRRMATAHSTVLTAYLKLLRE